MTEKSYALELIAFQRESNHIEGIVGVSGRQIEALETLLAAKRMDVSVLSAYVAVIQPNARLRATPDIPGVRVGNHIAPSSGPELMEQLGKLLSSINRRVISAHEAHCAYETLHPFTDGNGRSGRALWLWMRHGKAPLGFLHHFYYETLAALEGRNKISAQTYGTG